MISFDDKQGEPCEDGRCRFKYANHDKLGKNAKLAPIVGKSLNFASLIIRHTPESCFSGVQSICRFQIGTPIKFTLLFYCILLVSRLFDVLRDIWKDLACIFNRLWVPASWVPDVLPLD